MTNTLHHRIWEDYMGKKLLLIAMSLVLLIHGVIIYYTMPSTYDAYVHIFFGDHYGRFWFEPWDHRWYTGFLTISYPPLLHQMIALLGKLFPYKVAFCIYAIFIFEVLVVGVYRFTKLFFNKQVAGVASLVALVGSSMIETLHVFGQMPTLHGISFLLNALPFLYQYIVKGRIINLVMAMAFLSVVVSSHHVTAIFGQIFFIAPTIFMALYDRLSPGQRNKNLISMGLSIVREAFRRYKQLFLFVAIFGTLAVTLIFPYWYWSKSDPINQVSIPHGSRDNFFHNTSSGLVFFLIPLALVISYFPAISYAITRQRRLLGWAFSFFLCFLLGSGGTTPLPKKILGANAFNILTLDRFGFWASVIAIPFIARFITSLLTGPAQDFWIKRFGKASQFILLGVLGFSYFLFVIFVFHLGSFRPLQPKEIEIQPLVNFLNRDEHMRWRFLTLGFGDQMAWLSANSMAASVDGNYHSARRLPELTTRPVERLENAKYSGEFGLASLRDFLEKSEKYSLKYVFSNDRYYDPLLYFTGWTRVIQLENGIMVWEKGNIPTITPVKPKEIKPLFKKAWGILPVSSLCMAILLSMIYLRWFKQRDYFDTIPENDNRYPKFVIYSSVLVPIGFFTIIMLVQIRELLFVKEQKDPVTTVLSFYNHLDFQRFETAFHFFTPSHTYTLDQYLLEKSVTEGGLLPSYAKLDSIHADIADRGADTAKVNVFTRWRTSLAMYEQRETINTERIGKAWYIRPPAVKIEMAREQMNSYQYTLFRKMGKRLISAFPTVKDDRIKKPFVKVKQAQLVRRGQQNFITGELLNADDVPVNSSLRVIIRYQTRDTIHIFYPGYEFIYNLSPKASSFFQVQLDSTRVMDSLCPVGIELRVETDVSERGYIHSGTTGYAVTQAGTDSATIHTVIYNQLTTDINVPGILVAEKDVVGNIWQVVFAPARKAVRSGLSNSFDTPFKKKQRVSKLITEYPITVFVNGQLRSNHFHLAPDEDAAANKGLALLPNCFIAAEIFLE